MKRLLFDLIYATMFVILVGAPLCVVLELHAVLLAGSPLPVIAFALPVEALLFLLSMVAVATLFRLCLPRIRTGKYPFPSHAQSVVWGLHFLLQRVVYFPAFRYAFFSHASLRWLLLRGLGGRVAFAIDTSSDVSLLDPSLLEIGEGVTLAGGVLLAGHMIESEHITLAAIRIGRGTQVLASAAIMPGVTVGEHVVIGPETKLAPFSVVGDHVRMGAGCRVAPGVSIGAHAVVGHEVALEAGVIVGEGSIIASGARVPRGTRILDGERFPPRIKNDIEEVSA